MTDHPLSCPIGLSVTEASREIRNISWRADAAYAAILPAKGSESAKVKAHEKAFLEGSAELIRIVGFERFATILRSIQDETAQSDRPGLPPILSVVIHGTQSFWAQAYREAKLHGTMSALDEMLEPHDVDIVQFEEWVTPMPLHDQVVSAYEAARNAHMYAYSLEGLDDESILGVGIEMSNGVIAILPEWEELALINELKSAP